MTAYTSRETQGLALDFIPKWEGFSATVYEDSVGVPTIGYGFTPAVPEYEALADDAPITTERAGDCLWSILSRRVIPFVRALDEEKVLDAPHKVVPIVSWAYNVGKTAAKESTLAVRLRAGKEEAVEQELLRWVYAGGEVVEGLRNRREAERRLMERDERVMPPDVDTEARQVPSAKIEELASTPNSRLANDLDLSVSNA